MAQRVEPPILSILRAVAGGEPVAGCRDIEPQQLDWVLSTGLGPLLRHLAPDGYLAPRLDEQLLRSELQAKINAKLLRSAMASIIDSCDGRMAGGFTLLKGISICDQHYPEPHLRPMADIDFLVLPEDVPTVEAELAKLGYRRSSLRPPSFYESHHHTMPFTHPATRVRVEVHTELLPPTSELARTEVFSAASVRQESRPSSFDGRPAFRLGDELQLLFIASDTRWERWILGSPVPFVDILFLLRGAGARFSWDRIVAWMDHPRVAVHVSLVLTFLSRHRLVDLSPAVTTALRAASRRLGPSGLRILLREVERHSLLGLPLEDRLGLENRRIVWETLLSDRSQWLKLLLVPWNLAFPPEHPERFRPRLALRRLRSALSSSGRPPASDRPPEHDPLV